MMKRIVLGAGRALLSDEGGQAMLEYIIIIVFSIIVTIVFFKGVQRIVRRTANALSTSCDTD